MSKNTPIGTPLFTSTLKEEVVAGSVAWLPNGHLCMVTVDAHYHLVVWNIVSGDVVQSFQGHMPYAVNNVIPDAYDDSPAKRWDTSITWSPNRRLISSFVRGDRRRVWEVSSGKETPSAEFPMRWVLSPDGSRVAAVEENRLGIYELASGRLLTQMQHMPQRSRITTLAWSPDGHWLAGGTGTVNIGYPDDVEIRVWETDSGRLIGRESSYGSEWTANLSWSPDGTLLAYSSESVNIAVHEVPSWHHRATWRSDTGTTRTLAFSPDGRFIACACFNAFETGCSAIYLWEVATGEICFIYRDHEARERNTPAINWPLGAIRSSVNQITWALDGKRVASVSSFRKQEKDDVITIRDIHIWQAVEEAT